ncbi:hypothetical protein Mmah_1485 [Methanohalophilus mahii DSM 5219]|uniref:Uncharacterized protein n=1 Tax=Methanohalophilus mahii (strain ATCC 35705 / DSM 5219 / SLP) TaxID=547558 RepID=D5E743_METMS|nr:hypothetical protein Mmah_1485 [Methanohalophilus mahii DSM 5219]
MKPLSGKCRRGDINHHSPLDPVLADGESRQDTLVTSIDGQKDALRKKGCNCKI